MQIFCTGCGCKVEARLTSGAEIYPHRHDLASLPFWKCDVCRNYVGCHHKTNNPTNPLGNIPTKELRNARGHIHKILDPLWQRGIVSRKEIYKRISEITGRKYHTAQIRSIEEARKIYAIVNQLKKEFS